MEKNQNVTRRQFMATGTAAAAAFTVLSRKTVMGAGANEKIKLGVIGCGGRGRWISRLFVKHGGYEIAACADYFQDRVDAFGDEFKIPSDKRCTGLSGYKRLIESGGVDAITIMSPPYFHPEQARAGVAAGKHVYLAKPMAVDVPGCHSIQKSSDLAAANKQVFLIDFQTRANDYFIEAVKKVHEGAIGEIAFGEASYHAGSPWTQWFELFRKNPENPEVRLRGWGMSRELSGDIITEQNIHTLDVMNWIMQSPPLYAVGTGGLKVREKHGNCYDHYACLYQYPNQVGITFSSRQFKGHGSTPEGIRNRMFGSEGVLETEYGGQVLIRGNHFYRGGRTNNLYEAGAVNNIAAFHKNIMEENYEQSTVTPSVRSNLITLLGRKAAYTGEQVYWYQLIKDDEVMQPDLKGLKA